MTRPRPLPPPAAVRESCGDCSLCCKLMAVVKLKKPTCQWCVHAEVGRLPGACTIYETRPAECADFKCLWLMSHEDNDKTPMPLQVKPINSHVVFGAVMLNGKIDEMATSCHVDPAYPNAWRTWPIEGMIAQMINQGIVVIVYLRGKRTLLRAGQPPRDIGPEEPHW